MPTTTTVAALLAVPLLLGVTACSDGDKQKAAGAAGASCTGVALTDSNATLPAGFPALDGQTLYMPSTQGKTMVVFGRVSGSQNDLVTIRDSIATKVKAAGYTIEGTDQEKGAEADLELSGPHAGTINVRPLCQGMVAVRYRFTS